MSDVEFRMIYIYSVKFTIQNPALNFACYFFSTGALWKRRCRERKLTEADTCDLDRSGLGNDELTAPVYLKLVRTVNAPPGRKVDPVAASQQIVRTDIPADTPVAASAPYSSSVAGAASTEAASTLNIKTCIRP